MRRANVYKIIDDSRNRSSQLLEFLEAVAKTAHTANIDHFFRAGKIEDKELLRHLGQSFLTLAMGFEADEFMPFVGSGDGPDFVPQSEDYHPWVLYTVPTQTEDLMDVYHKRGMAYLHSEGAGRKDYVLIMNLRRLIVCDLKHLIPEYEISFLDIYDAIISKDSRINKQKSLEGWTSLLTNFGPTSATDKKKQRRLEVISYQDPKESRVEFVKRFGHMPNFEKPIGWDGKDFRETFKTKDLPFLATETFETRTDAKTMTDRLIWGDNLAAMRSLPDECIDLIYIDPPFFSGRNYNLIFGDDDEVRTFRDIWEGGLPTYLAWLNARLYEMKRLLKRTGNLCVHLDWHAVHYVKCELDKIFGYENFRNEIIWTYSGGAVPTKDLPRKHDNILRYAKSNEWTFNTLYRPYNELTAKRMQHIHKGVMVDVERGTPITDWWTEVKVPTGPRNKEKIGYPTQKPVELAGRIIDVLTNPGDVVADLFCGGGTTIIAAQGVRKIDGELVYKPNLARHWIGCDISRIAVSVTRDRLLAVDANPKDDRSTNQRRPITFRVENHGSYDKALVRELKEGSYVTFILKCFEASPTSRGRLIQGFKSDKAVHVVPPKQPLTIETIEEFHFALSQQGIISGIVLAWDWEKECDDFLDQLRQGAEGPDVQLVQVKLLNIDSHEFKGENIRFLNKPAALIASSHKEGLTWIFDGSRSQGRNGTDIHYYQWDFDYDGRFSPMTKPSFRNDEERNREPLNDNRRVEYQFPHHGKFKIALRIFDKSGADDIDIREVDVTTALQKAA